MSDIEVDLVADLNAQDDDGYCWSLLSRARHGSRVKAGAMLLAGNRPCDRRRRRWPGPLHDPSRADQQEPSPARRRASVGHLPRPSRATATTRALRRAHLMTLGAIRQKGLRLVPTRRRKLHHSIESPPHPTRRPRRRRRTPRWRRTGTHRRQRTSRTHQPGTKPGASRPLRCPRRAQHARHVGPLELPSSTTTRGRDQNRHTRHMETMGPRELRRPRATR
jgi:hypothetical protein